MTVRCSQCGQEWPRDPALEVACPTCLAGVGQRCRRPGGYTGNFVGVHASRDRAAMQAGFLQPCPAASRDGKKNSPPPPQGQLALPI